MPQGSCSLRLLLGEESLKGLELSRMDRRIPQLGWPGAPRHVTETFKAVYVFDGIYNTVKVLRRILLQPKSRGCRLLMAQKIKVDKLARAIDSSTYRSELGEHNDIFDRGIEVAIGLGDTPGATPDPLGTGHLLIAMLECECEAQPILRKLGLESSEIRVCLTGLDLEP